MMCKYEEARGRPGSHAGPSNDGVMRTYETTGLVMLGPLVGAFHHSCFKFRAQLLRGGCAPYQYERDDSGARQHDGGGQG
jgi:hypothetical protein